MPTPRPIDRRSATLLIRLARVPRFLLILGALALLLGGLFAPGIIGALLLLVMAALIGWLAWLGRAGQTPGALALRGIVVIAFLVLAASKLAG